jgi:hypothetical protein
MSGGAVTAAAVAEEPETPDPTIANAGTQDDPDDDDDPSEVVETDTGATTRPSNNAGSRPKSADINAIAKRLAAAIKNNTPADELYAMFSEEEQRAIETFVEGGGDLDALVEKYAGAQAVAVPPVEKDPSESPEPSDSGTGLKAGKAIDGFPVPAGARSTFSTAQAELFEISAPGRDIIAFYKRQLRGRYAMEDIPNGLSIKDPDSPFSFVVLSANGDTLMLSLTRNVLAPSTEAANTHDADEAVFGVKIPGKTTIIVRSDTAVVLRSRMSMEKMCDYLRNNYGKLPKVVTVGDPDGATPSCVVANSGGDYPWQAITAVNDPQSEGALMISIAKKQ